MGLVARVIEAAGIPTVTLNMIWVLQRAVGMPRVAALEHPFGRPFGDVGDTATQRAVLEAGLAQVGASEPSKRIITGAVIVVAVIIDTLRQRRADRRLD